MTLRPATSSEKSWSEARNRYVRNVEAVGSNPITSTKSPGQGVGGGIPPEFHVVRRERDVIGEESAFERYVVIRRTHGSRPEGAGQVRVRRRRRSRLHELLPSRPRRARGGLWQRPSVLVSVPRLAVRHQGPARRDAAP